MRRIVVFLLISAMLFTSLTGVVNAAESSRRRPPPKPKPAPVIQLEEIQLDGVIWHVYIKQVGQTEPVFTQNPDLRFHPASMIKLPIAVLVLTRLEARGYHLKELETRGVDGRTYDQLMEAMLVRSEEPATEILQAYVFEEARNSALLQTWGMSDTFLEPRRTTAADLALFLEKLYTGELLGEEFTNYLLDKLSAYTPTDERYLGIVKFALPGSKLYNKRGTLVDPVIVADMGILEVGNKAYVIVVSANKQTGSHTFEDIQAALETFAGQIASSLKE